jgi:hypothetical protein
MEPMTTQAAWIIAAAIAMVPLTFVLVPLLVQLVHAMRRGHGIAPASRGTPGS